MAISRREMLTFGALSGGAMMIPPRAQLQAAGRTGSRRAPCRRRSPSRSRCRRSPRRCADDGTTTSTRCRCASSPGRDPAGPHRRRSGATTASRPGPRSTCRRAASASSASCDLPAVHPSSATTSGPRPTCTARLAAAVRRLRQRHHQPGRVQGLPVPERPGRAHALVPRPRRPHHRRERLHGPRAQYLLHDPLERASLPIPHGDYDVPLILKDAMFDDRRRADLRRQRTDIGHVRRRHPRQRRAVAGDAGRAAQVPLPHPQRVGLALLPPGARARASRSSSSAPTAASCPRRRPSPAALGMAERYEVVIDFAKYQHRARASSCRTSARRTTSTSPHRHGHGLRRRRRRRHRRSNNAIPHRPQPGHRVMGLHRGQAVTHPPRCAFERARTASGRSTADVGGRRQQRLHAGRSANPTLGDVEIWEIENTRAAGSTRPHPPRRLQDPRPQRRGRRSPYEHGPKDVVYVGENETVRVIMRFEPAASAGT